MYTAAIYEAMELNSKCEKEHRMCQCYLSWKKTAARSIHTSRKANVYEKRRQEHFTKYCTLRKQWRVVKEREHIYRRDVWYFSEYAKFLYRAAEEYLHQ